MWSLFGNFGGNLENLTKVFQDEHFRKFLANPKVQELMQDSDFKRAVEEKNVFKLMSHQGFMELMKDPEVRAALQGIGNHLKKSE